MTDSLRADLRERVTTLMRRVGVYGRARTVARSNKAIAAVRESAESLALDLQAACARLAAQAPVVVAAMRWRGHYHIVNAPCRECNALAAAVDAMNGEDK